MAGLQFGIKEIADCIVGDFKTKKPLFYVDYAQVTTNEVAGERTPITGGKGNPTLMAFDHSKTSTFSMTLPLVDVKILAMLSGSDLAEGAGEIFKREVHTVQEDGVTPGTPETDITLEKAPIAGTVTVFKLEGERDHGEEMTSTVTGSTLTLTTPPAVGEEIVVYYQYAAPTTAQKITISSNKFSKAVFISGLGLGRNAMDEQDYPVHVHAYKARVQPNYTVTMSATDPTVLELMFDLYEVKDTTTGEGKFIDYIFETE